MNNLASASRVAPSRVSRRQSLRSASAHSGPLLPTPVGKEHTAAQKYLPGAPRPLAMEAAEVWLRPPPDKPGGKAMLDGEKIPGNPILHFEE